MLNAALLDIRYAIRALRRSPGFSAVAILSLALGIGANTAIFSLINPVILKTLPVSHPEQLIRVTMGEQATFTNPLWEQIRDRQDIFSGIFAYGGGAASTSRQAARAAMLRAAT
jgi:putative ABC transport system permease protein